MKYYIIPSSKHLVVVRFLKDILNTLGAISMDFVLRPAILVISFHISQYARDSTALESDQ